MYYDNKINMLKSIFGTEELEIKDDALHVEKNIYPIIDDVIVVLHPSKYPEKLRRRLEGECYVASEKNSEFSADVQYSFGEEWQLYPDILPEHQKEFDDYFDLVDLDSMQDFRVCDLGCGIGRWSYLLKDYVKELVLVDFSEAIFVARKNLKEKDSAVFFMGDIKDLPFQDNFVDFLFSLGVLHHIPSPALTEVRNLKKYAPTLLIYLYYALDNRPAYFRGLLFLADNLRKLLSGIKGKTARSLITWLLVFGLYYPFIMLGKLANIVGLKTKVPLYGFYNGFSAHRIKQDAYDRFFTSVEQRFSAKQILELKDVFSEVEVSQRLPYWHFICKS